MTANLTIPIQSADNVPAVPLAAVFADQGNRFVYVQQGDKFARVPVLIGVSDDNHAEVTTGLKAGETVSLVTPAEDAGNVQPAFDAAARGGKRLAGALSWLEVDAFGAVVKGGRPGGNGGEAKATSGRRDPSGVIAFGSQNQASRAQTAGQNRVPD